MRRTTLERATRVIVAASLALLLAGACADPDPRPRCSVELLAAWDVAEAEAAGARILVRITCIDGADAERFGLTVRVDSGKRRYWASLEEASALPRGASTTRTIAISFAAADERIAEGSAAVESSWFE